MDSKQARRKVWRKQTSLPHYPDLPAGPHEAQEEDEALCARYEAEIAALAEAETASGCDYSEGALSPSGCLW